MGYDLVSMDGKSSRTGPSGPCLTKSVMDDPGLTLNDPTPDLLEITPDGKYFTIAFRGPKSVSVPHSAQGSCPGVGIVEITENGRSGSSCGCFEDHKYGRHCSSWYHFWRTRLYWSRTKRYSCSHYNIEMTNIINNSLHSAIV